MADATPATPIGVVEPQRSTAKGAKLGGSGAGDSDEVYSLTQGDLQQYSEGPAGSEEAPNAEIEPAEEAESGDSAAKAEAAKGTVPGGTAGDDTVTESVGDQPEAKAADKEGPGGGAARLADCVEGALRGDVSGPIGGAVYRRVAGGVAVVGALCIAVQHG